MKTKMNFTSDQTAYEYAIYMIAGSYFPKTKCISPLQEKKMRLQYCEQKVTNQYKMEENCIAYIENTLLQKMPKALWKQNMEAQFLVDQETGLTEIRFKSEHYILRLWGTYAGSRSRVHHQLWVSDKVLEEKTKKSNKTKKEKNTSKSEKTDKKSKKEHQAA